MPDLPLVTREDNRAYLFDRFAQRLLEQAPGSVLDVGCGRGGLLRRCEAAGVAAVGLEEDAERAEELVRAGLDVRRGRAEQLPFEDGAFEWVTMRHVPHHLVDPPRAVAEALRVASVGVLLAEPWYDRFQPSQDVGWRIDQWLRADDRRAGMVHGEGFAPLELAALILAAAPDATVELETHLKPAVEDLAALSASIGARLASVGSDHPEAAVIAALLARAAETGAGLGGSAFAWGRLSSPG
ncbi:class I SAM-dependent methyltransferase [Engelhardtia mirabilis]|uniref:Methyltransferase type 11 domain-containing protein n=1 Tax=Engelhardtia mirabilis TaxID=2528011 RepID=A0A518BGD1_9BACT|nr:hypothetical protein Pla133_11040 [Planctomycetes bacterium Pla133]QDV00365.1 hypothetical protein Pla86_11040 [Planctomycetes bacterium Pla86]